MTEIGTFIHKSALIDEPCKIGKNTKIWSWCHISKNSKIGENCTLGQNVFIGENVIVGNNVKIQNNVSIYDGVVLEDFVFCGPSCVFTNVINPRSAFPTKKYIKTVVKKNATIGGNSTIICGSTIGEYAFVGAGSVVTKDVKSYSLVYGNPASHKGWVSKLGKKLDKNFVCPVTKKKYLFLLDSKKKL